MEKSKRLVCGVGTNDAEYQVRVPNLEGKRVKCPFYSKWENMLNRCYSPIFHKSRPTYMGCSVDPSWLLFSNFRKWMIKQDWEGKQLDKDILIQGNKVYSEHTCIFVTNEINNLLGICTGDYLKGVSWDQNKYRADIRFRGKRKFLGSYDTEEEASEAYNTHKYKIIAEVAAEQEEPLRSALLRLKVIQIGDKS